jgi:hypothetical protein
MLDEYINEKFMIILFGYKGETEKCHYRVAGKSITTIAEAQV